jgi:hypothetical protein
MDALSVASRYNKLLLACAQLNPIVQSVKCVRYISEHVLV